jgi:dTDP-4-amino-4,6-dideoxygalactose transaminase
LTQELESIEDSGIFTNYGPVNNRFEATLTKSIFGGVGHCVTVGNATLGLMLAIREAVSARIGTGASKATHYALMPSFTFAAAGHAAIWAGLTPLLCDIDSENWASCPKAEDRLFEQYAGEIACVVPYAPFGNCIDLDRYERLAREHAIGVVVDAAGSLGSLDQLGRGFGAGFPYAIVYSMHATKTFAVGEGGVIYSGDADRVQRLRAMGNFGFGQSRTATMPGMNSKLSEVGALLALSKLHGFDEVVAHRARLARAYRASLPSFTFQRVIGCRIAYQFMPVLLPVDWSAYRAALLARLAAGGIGAAHYFSPHLAEHPYFADICRKGELTVTQQISSRILSLPMADEMNLAEVDEVSGTLLEAMQEVV